MDRDAKFIEHMDMAGPEFHDLPRSGPQDLRLAAELDFEISEGGVRQFRQHGNVVLS